jgi:lipoprotein-anchoring transpeptidase ErfK/SrfK
VRGGVIAFAGIVAIAGVLAATSLKPEVRATGAGASVVPAATSHAGDRLFLTKSQLDQAIASGTLDRPVTSLLAVKAPLRFGDYSWDDRGVPAGPTWIRVDLGSQLMSVFRGANEIGTAVIVYGGDNKQTPSGKLHILGKARDHRSSLYDAQMPYTLRLTNDGVSIHASSVRWGAATHGCIGIPLPFAQRLFDAAGIGDEVIIVGGAPIKKAT